MHSVSIRQCWSGLLWSQLCHALPSLPWQGLWLSDQSEETRSLPKVTPSITSLFPTAPGTYFCQSTSHMGADLSSLFVGLVSSWRDSACQIHRCIPSEEEVSPAEVQPSSALSRENNSTQLGCAPFSSLRTQHCTSLLGSIITDADPHLIYLICPVWLRKNSMPGLGPWIQSDIEEWYGGAWGRRSGFTFWLCFDHLCDSGKIIYFLWTSVFSSTKLEY